jgi:hypothetical protein
MGDVVHEFKLIGTGPRPPYYLVAEHLWGAADVDSDGNSTDRDATDWTELTLILRPHFRERIDVDPVKGAEPLTLLIKSEDRSLAQKAAAFLLAQAGGRLADQER